MATFVLWAKYTHVYLNIDLKSIFSAFFWHLPGELKQKLEASIEMSYVLGFAYSLDWTTIKKFTRHQGTWVQGVG